MQSSPNYQWPQNYQEILDSIDPDLLTFDEPYDVPNLSPSPTGDALSPKASCNSPRGSTGKPFKRRSRASKKAPTTLLKADASNFRALVQQFTGFHRPEAPGFGSYKGPINLNFEQCTYYPKEKEKQKQKQLVDDHNYNKLQLNHNYSSINSAAMKIDDDDLFGSRDDDRNPRAEALTYDGCDVEEIWGQEMSESGEYPAVLPGMIEDGFWGY